MFSYRGWLVECENGLYKVWCDDILYSFNTEDEAEVFIDNMIKKGCDIDD